jgi:hypothetical protein
VADKNEDAYAKRQRRKKAEGQACLPLAAAMAGTVLAAVVALVEGVGRLV